MVKWGFLLTSSIYGRWLYPSDLRSDLRFLEAERLPDPPWVSRCQYKLEYWLSLPWASTLSSASAGGRRSWPWRWSVFPADQSQSFSSPWSSPWSCCPLGRTPSGTSASPTAGPSSWESAGSVWPAQSSSSLLSQMSLPRCRSSREQRSLGSGLYREVVPVPGVESEASQTLKRQQ